MLFFFVKRKSKMVNDIRNIFFSNYSYEDVIKTLNSLPSNADLLKKIQQQGKLAHSATVSSTLERTKKYLFRTGTKLKHLDQLSVIHVAGSKGKGSTSAYCESILRHHGYRTGLFSSPHLVSVRERIRISGQPISKDLFCAYFWNVYNKLKEKQEHENDMPFFFNFLTILAFNVFLQEKVDVAVIEVGIGGEYDCTNILRKVPVVGITSLEIEHINVLGKTIQEIAWQKAGIMKKNAYVYTVPQKEEAMKILKKRSIEKQSIFSIIQTCDNYEPKGISLIPEINTEFQKLNASLAIQLSHSWMLQNEKRENVQNGLKLMQLNNIPEKTKLGLIECIWPGRYQILNTSKARFFLDGAHTENSLKLCVQWFYLEVLRDHIPKPKVLLFNTTGDRNSEQLLKVLWNCDFDHVIFVPNIAQANNGNSAEHISSNISDHEQILRCENHKNIWQKNKQNISLLIKQTQTVSVHSNVLEALQNLSSSTYYNILVTGSLYLVGAVLSLLDPELKSCNMKEL